MTARLDIQEAITEGWALFVENAAKLVVATLIYLLLHLVSKIIPAFIGLALVHGPLLGGFFLLVADMRKGRDPDYLRIFDGFRNFGPMVLIGILTSIFMMVGFVAIILPGILITGWYFFAYLFASEKGLDFWEAMEESRKIGFDRHLDVFIFALVLIVFNFVGFLTFGLGLLITIPLSICSVTVAYDKLVGFEELEITSAPPTPPPPTDLEAEVKEDINTETDEPENEMKGEES